MVFLMWMLFFDDPGTGADDQTAGIDFVNLSEGDFDAPLGPSTGAADILELPEALWKRL